MFWVSRGGIFFGTYEVTGGVLLLGGEDTTLALSGVQGALALDDSLAGGHTGATVLAADLGGSGPVIHFCGCMWCLRVEWCGLIVEGERWIMTKARVRLGGWDLYCTEASREWERGESRAKPFMV